MRLRGAPPRGLPFKGVAFTEIDLQRICRSRVVTFSVCGHKALNVEFLNLFSNSQCCTCASEQSMLMCKHLRRIVKLGFSGKIIIYQATA